MSEKKNKAEKAVKKATGEKKPERKELEKEVKDDRGAKKKFIKIKLEKIKIPSNKKSKELQKKIKNKKKVLFRGKFGKRNRVRSIKKEKWQRWRKARGINANQSKKGDTAMPSIGFGLSKIIRGMHPSGCREMLIRNMKDLELAEKKSKKEKIAVKLSGTIGLKKRNEIIKKTNELKIKVLN